MVYGTIAGAGVQDVISIDQLFKIPSIKEDRWWFAFWNKNRQCPEVVYTHVENKEDAAIKGALLQLKAEEGIREARKGMSYKNRLKKNPERALIDHMRINGRVNKKGKHYG